MLDAMTIDSAHLRQWLGRVREDEDEVTLAPARALAAVLDLDGPAPRRGEALPPLWHWLYALPHERQSAIGSDGHPKRGDFLPPVPLPRRMWAGGRLQFVKPLRIGEAIRRTSTIADISAKDGRSGPLVFVRVKHEIAGSEGVAIVEEQDIVYRADPAPDAPAPRPEPAPAGEQYARTVHPEPVLLFRYSALTFNGHRIHYDRPYAQDVEGYVGLVVHGPLIATLLVDALARQQPGVQIASFSFKAMRPLFDTADFSVCSRIDAGTAALWARDAQGFLAMQASATLA